MSRILSNYCESSVKIGLQTLQASEAGIMNSTHWVIYRHIGRFEIFKYSIEVFSSVGGRRWKCLHAFRKNISAAQLKPWELETDSLLNCTKHSYTISRPIQKLPLSTFSTCFCFTRNLFISCRADLENPSKTEHRLVPLCQYSLVGQNNGESSLIGQDLFCLLHWVASDDQTGVFYYIKQF